MMSKPKPDDEMLQVIFKDGNVRRFCKKHSQGMIFTEDMRVASWIKSWPEDFCAECPISREIKEV